MKRSGLRIDPAKVRAFQQRGREKSPLRRDTTLVERIARPTMQRQERPQERATAPAAEPKLPKIRFKPQDHAGDHLCVRCLRQGRRKRAVHWHHWLAQQQIRVYVRGLRLEHHETCRLLKRLIHDERNLSPMCFDCHGAGELHATAFTKAEVPLDAFTFASELGGEWIARLHRAYP